MTIQSSHRTVAVTLLSLLSTAALASDCLSGSPGGDAAKVCASSAEVIYEPADGDYAHASWRLIDGSGKPLPEGTQVEIATLQYLGNMPAGMPPVDVTYTEKVDSDGYVHVHCRWSDRRIELTLKALAGQAGAYVGSGDKLLIEPGR